MDIDFKGEICQGHISLFYFLAKNFVTFIHISKWMRT